MPHRRISRRTRKTTIRIKPIRSPRLTSKRIIRKRRVSPGLGTRGTKRSKVVTRAKSRGSKRSISRGKSITRSVITFRPLRRSRRRK